MFIFAVDGKFLASGKISHYNNQTSCCKLYVMLRKRKCLACMVCIILPMRISKTISLIRYQKILPSMASYAIYLLCWGKMWTVCRKQWHDWLFSFYDEGKAWISIIQRSVQFDIQPFPIIDIFEWYETYKSYVNYVAMLSRREEREGNNGPRRGIPV